MEHTVIIFLGISISIFLLAVSKMLWRETPPSKQSAPRTPVRSLDTEYLIFRSKLDNELHKNKQALVDLKVAGNIEREAYRLFSEYMCAEEITIEGRTFKNRGLVIANPAASAYLIYDIDTAKYRDQNISELIMNRYKELIKEAELAKTAEKQTPG